MLATILKLLATGTITVFLAACYGVMMQWKRVTALSPEGTGIASLHVTLKDGPDELQNVDTDASGIAELVSLRPMEGLAVAIEDVDGEANGGQFLPAEITLDARPEYTVTLTRP